MENVALLQHIQMYFHPVWCTSSTPISGQLHVTCPLMEIYCHPSFIVQFDVTVPSFGLTKALLFGLHASDTETKCELVILFVWTVTEAFCVPVSVSAHQNTSDFMSVLHVARSDIKTRIESAAVDPHGYCDDSYVA